MFGGYDKAKAYRKQEERSDIKIIKQTFKKTGEFVHIFSAATSANALLILVT